MMIAHEINIVLQIACLTLLGLAGILLLRHSKTGPHTWTGIGLIISVIAYLLLETPFVKDRQILFLLAATAAMSIPVFFFLLTKAIFDDHWRFRVK
jgi:hypothetical protein